MIRQQRRMMNKKVSKGSRFYWGVLKHNDVPFALVKNVEVSLT